MASSGRVDPSGRTDDRPPAWAMPGARSTHRRRSRWLRQERAASAGDLWRAISADILLRSALQRSMSGAMPLDVVDLRAFYASPLGHVARRFIGRAMLRFWPDCARQRLLGLGYSTPYLSVLGLQAERTIAFMPAAQGVVNWPSPGLTASALVEPT